MCMEMSKAHTHGQAEGEDYDQRSSEVEIWESRSEPLFCMTHMPVGGVFEEDTMFRFALSGLIKMLYFLFLFLFIFYLCFKPENSFVLKCFINKILD